MSWILYKNWSGNVINSKIRVPLTYDGIFAACYGKSFNALSLRPGSVGNILNILSENRKPYYVQCMASIDYLYAAEVRFFRNENTEVMWKDFSNVFTGEFDEVVVIPFKILSNFEIEY